MDQLVVAEHEVKDLITSLISYDTSEKDELFSYWQKSDDKNKIDIYASLRKIYLSEEEAIKKYKGSLSNRIFLKKLFLGTLDRSKCSEIKDVIRQLLTSLRELHG